MWPLFLLQIKHFLESYLILPRVLTCLREIPPADVVVSCVVGSANSQTVDNVLSVLRSITRSSVVNSNVISSNVTTPSSDEEMRNNDMSSSKKQAIIDIQDNTAEPIANPINAFLSQLADSANAPTSSLLSPLISSSFINNDVLFRFIQQVRPSPHT